ncbi:MAG TPA: hypothetical protein VFO55_09915, partial [Gemmatimonadaceae bacterium]|nr:hypothetical protein [Gemmatimonadaceae bacterium]
MRQTRMWAACAALALAAACRPDGIAGPDATGVRGAGDVEVPVNVGSLAISILYKGELVGYPTTGCAGFNYELRNLGSNQLYTVMPQSCGPYQTAAEPVVVRDLPAGSYRLRVVAGATLVAPGQPVFEM